MADERKRTKRSPRGRVLVITSWVVSASILLVVGGLAVLYWKFNGNLRGIDIDGALGKDRPGDVNNGSMDILVLGSDSRTGENGRYGGTSNGAARSDTTMVVHIARGHKRASVVSIPRDTLLPRPPCRRTGGQGKEMAPAVDRAMFNEAYEVGGPACAVKTVEAMSRIRMDHYVEIDFTGFKELVDALGGVTVTVKQPISDEESHLQLAPGTHHLRGEQALGFVRTRHGIGDGSDLGRIGLQQQFMLAVLKQVHKINLFGSPTKLYKVANAATKAITTDSDIASIKALMDLADSVKRINTGDLRTVMLPVAYDPVDPNRVTPKVPEASQVWAALRADAPIPRSADRDQSPRPTVPSTPTAPSRTAPAVPSTPPGRVSPRPSEPSTPRSQASPPPGTSPPARPRAPTRTAGPTGSVPDGSVTPARTRPPAVSRPGTGGATSAG